MNYHNKRFKAITNSENGEIDSEMIFHYHQTGNILSCTYRGGEIAEGHLLGLVDLAGNIEMSYHQVNKKGVLMTGTCASRRETMSNGKIRLYESWKWTSGDLSEGRSILEEI